jgi:hypothetical protein
MMGGFGSGRRSGSGRGKVEACRSIDVNRLHREGCLREGWTGAWLWTCDGETVASINLSFEHERVLVAMKPLDFRKGMNGLAAPVQEQLMADPFSATIYCFRSKRALDRATRAIEVKDHRGDVVAYV